MKNKVSKIILIIFAIMMTICSILTFVFFNKSKYNIYSENYNYNWKINGNNVQLGKIKSDVIAKKTITYEDINKNIVISSKNLIIDIYIDDKEVYKTEESSNKMFGEAPGVSYSFFTIKSEDIGKTIKLDIKTPYSDGGKIIKIIKGEEVETFRRLFKDNFLQTCISSSIVIISFIVIILFFPLRKHTKITGELLYLSLFTLNIGIFLFLDSNMLQLIYGNNYFFHTIAELWMLIIAVPFNLFIKNTYKEKSNKGLILISSICIFIFLFNILSDLFGILDLHKTVLLVHVTYALSAIYAIYTAIKNKNKASLNHLYAIFIFLLFAFIDILGMWVWKFNYSSLYTIIGIVFFMAFEAINVLNNYLDDYKEKTKVEILKDLAYHDGLTGLLNRTSFIEKMYDLENDKKEVAIVMFDVNDLKQTNDKLGHTYGDKLIKGASLGILESFGRYGNIYRIGGDEFVAIIEKKFDYNKTLEKMNKELLKYKDENLIITIACGMAIYDSSKHKTMKKVYEEADKNMYKNKAKIKGQNNIR